MKLLMHRSLTCQFLLCFQADVDDEYELNKVKPKTIALVMGNPVFMRNGYFVLTKF